ncbi:helix-turn-helix transcriptional regulator [Staphylococcus caeli]|uniref:helix-turn-helix transcriptional regulator n=1 Tax=Staphylococcus caeli TaxID=2201815 RepID=UPI003F562274
MTNLVKGYRCAIGLSQKEMASKIDVSINTYAEKENGKRDFTRLEMKRYKCVLDEYDVSVDIAEIFYPQLQKLQIT